MKWLNFVPTFAQSPTISRGSGRKRVRRLPPLLLTLAFAGCAATSPQPPGPQTKQEAFQACLRAEQDCEADCDGWWHYVLFFAHPLCLSACLEVQDTCVSDAERITRTPRSVH